MLENVGKFFKYNFFVFKITIQKNYRKIIKKERITFGITVFRIGNL